MRDSDSHGHRQLCAECNMTAREGSGSPAPRVRVASAAPGRPYRISNAAPVEATEQGCSIAGRLAWLGARLTIWPALAIGSHRPFFPWPFGLIDSAARALPSIPGTIRSNIALSHCTAQLVRAKGVLPADGTGRVVLYLHGGAFLTCGAHSHGRMTTMISEYADAPLLVPSYRLMPKHSVEQALDDCYDGYQWLRGRGYRPNQIVLAGDSAGGYLALALAQRLLDEGEQPAALVGLSPLLQLDREPKKAHPNIRTDAMFPAKAFDALADLTAKAASRQVLAGRPEGKMYEPLDHIKPGLPPTLIHVSGSEVLLYDARLAAQRLAGAGVTTEVRVWPGQVHVFQFCAAIPEATQSLKQIGKYIQRATPTKAFAKMHYL
jgi:acetyl esterase/lipase